MVNTQGWVKGLGAELLERVKALVGASHLFIFAAPEESEQGWGDFNTGFHGTGGGQDDHEVRPCERIKLESAPSSPLDSKWSAADLRTLNLVSYFYCVFPAPVGDSMSSIGANTFPTRWDFDAPLVGKRPYTVDWTTQVHSVGIIDGEIAYEHVLHALNGTIVALVTSPSSSDEPAPSTSRLPYDLSLPLPTPPASNCLALALVRSIAPQSHALHLLTPLHPAHLTAPVHLIKGALELPLCLLLDYDATDAQAGVGVAESPWTEVPYLSVESGGGRKKVRRNLMRRGQ